MASVAARRAASSLTRLSSSLIHRRGLAGAAEHHGPTRVNCWQQPTNPANWKEEHFVIVSLTGWAVAIYGGYKFFTRGRNDEKLVEAAH